ncbi:hypothetical protein [Vibrio atypicus]|uniref:hypothetical protein n=1 Tax=Vibrio atypicus TaxID=558271 RepID=UPI0013569A88|nr:hypothetical protein [Vibrio atypicus]
MSLKRWFISLTTLFASSFWSLVLFASPPFDVPPGLEVAHAAQAKHGDALLQNSGIVGHGLSVDEAGNGVVVIFTDSPLVKGIPKWLDGVAVKQVYTGQFYAFAPPTCGGPPSQRPPECFTDPEPEPSVDPTARFDRPVPIGISSGHPLITAGTIGARVTDGINVYALSNNHVFSNSNDAFIGDNIIQPGSYDGGSESSDTFATLHAFVPILFDGSDNVMDAAIAISDESSLTTSTPEDGYGTPSSTVVAASPGQAVMKYGRTTGFTQGSVDSINATVNVCYEGSSSCTKLARFVGQVIITPGTFSAGGDSGSLIVTSSGNNPVGLLFAGSSSYTIASPIDLVLTEFGVTIDSNTPPPPPPSGDITLSVNGYKVKGYHHVSIDWGGAASVDIYRDDMQAPVYQDQTDDPFVDSLSAKGGGSYQYMVCETATNNCSPQQTVNF